MAEHGGTPRVQEQQTRKDQTVLTVTKALTKTTTVLVVTKSGGTRQQKIFRRFAPDMRPHFQILSGVTRFNGTFSTIRLHVYCVLAEGIENEQNTGE